MTDLRAKAAEVKRKAAETANEQMRMALAALSPDDQREDPPIPPSADEIPQIGAIAAHFEWAADRDPEPIAAKRLSLTSGKRSFSYTKQSTIRSMSHDVVEGWQGDTAEGLWKGFLDPLEDAHRLHLDLFDELTIALSEIEKINRKTQHDVNQIANQTIAVLNSLQKGGAGEPSQIGLTILSGLVSIAGAALGGPAGVGVTFAFLGASMSVASAVQEASAPGAAKPAGTVEGNYVADVLDSMFAAIAKLQKHDAQEIRKVAKALEDDYSIASSPKNYRLLCPPRPTAASTIGDTTPKKPVP